MNKKFWKNKNILITGYEGFLGSNLSRTLLCLGAKIIGLDINVQRKETLFTQDDYSKIITVKGSVTDYNLLKKIIQKYKIEIVFHLAAVAIVSESYKEPLCTFETNIMGTCNILEICRNSKTIMVIVIASSDKAYGSHRELPYKENAALQGNHPYDVSKSCADLIANTYSHTYELPVAITRCGNIYGPGDFNFSRVVPDCIKCIIQNRTFCIRSDGRFTRDYVYVDDIVNGYILLAEKLQKLKLGGEAFNFSDEKPITVTELVQKIFKISGMKPDYMILNQVKDEIKHQYLSSTKAKKILGWNPQYSLDEGLKNTINWYKIFFGG